MLTRRFEIGDIYVYIPDQSPVGKSDVQAVAAAYRLAFGLAWNNMASAAFGNRFRAFMNHPAGPKTGMFE